MKNKKFYSYFTGLIEGDGSIYIPSTSYNLQGKKLYPCIQISFSKQDFVLAQVLQKTLNTGSIHKKKNAQCYVYTINSPTFLKQLIPQISPYWRTPKINKFNLLANYFNEPKTDIDTSDLFTNSWLAGFIEADGSFYIRYTEKTKKVEAQFYLEQRILDISGESLENIMEKIAEKIGAKLKVNNRTNKNSSFRIRTTSLKTNKTLISYLEKYPLWGEKYLNYKSFCEVVNLIEKRKHLSDKGIEIIIKIKNNINTKRTFYNWDHLKFFYKIE